MSSHQASATLVQRLLHEAGYSLQANAKTLEGSQHPDRDAQFQHIHDTVARFLSGGDPVVSVDCKKKELVGQFKTAGGSGGPEVIPSTSTCTTSWTNSSARRSRTASTTSGQTPAGLLDSLQGLSSAPDAHAVVLTATGIVGWQHACQEPGSPTR